MKNILNLKHLFIELVKMLITTPTATIWGLLVFACVFLGGGYLGSLKLTIADQKATIEKQGKVIDNRDSTIGKMKSDKILDKDAEINELKELHRKTEKLKLRVK